jgi:hypothetical protein
MTDRYVLTMPEIRALVGALASGDATPEQQTTASDLLVALLLERDRAAARSRRGVKKDVRLARTVSIAITLVRHAGASVKGALLAADPTANDDTLPSLRKAYERAGGRITVPVSSADLQAARARLPKRR